MLRKGTLLLLICLLLAAGVARADRHANMWRFREAVPAKVLAALLENKTAPVKTYLDGGGNPNALLDGDPLLVLAANNGGEATMKLLLDRGAKVNLASTRGETALLRVCGHLYRIDPEAVQLLLQRGANVNQTFPKGTTALMLACSLHSRHEEGGSDSNSRRKTAA